VVAVYLVRCGVFWHYVNDDAFITFRYSRFLAIGRGPYFNIGEHVEGYTNFLLMLLMAPVFRLGGEAAVPVAAKAMGVASGVGSLLVAWALVRSILGGSAALHRYASAIGVGAAALVVASPAYAVNSTSGLATTLFGFLLILGVYLSIRGEERGSWCGAGIAFAGLILTRPEGVFLFAGPGLETARPLHHTALVDVLPTSLALSGLRIPEGLEGDCLLEECNGSPPSYYRTVLTRETEGIEASFSDQEEAEVMERLKKLGYL